MKYILFGAGRYGHIAEQIVGSNNVICYVDNCPPPEDNIPILNFQQLLARGVRDDEIVVITPNQPQAVIEIFMQLQKAGLRSMLLSDFGKEMVAREAERYDALNTRENFRTDAATNYYIWDDRFGNAGYTGGYFWMDLWAAEKIKEVRPSYHIDIGSRVDGFISHLMLLGQRVKVVDIRPADLGLPYVEFVQGDATNLSIFEDETIESLSALCSPEHFGLGRYGDSLDPEACFKFFRAISRKLKSKGRVYIAVPVGKEHVEFNAHRIFSPYTVIKEMGKEMLLREFSVTNGEHIEKNANIKKYDNLEGHVVGLFEFAKV